MEQQKQNVDTPFASLIMRHKLDHPTFGEAVNGRSKLEVKMEYDGVYMVCDGGLKVKVTAMVLDNGETLSL